MKDKIKILRLQNGSAVGLKETVKGLVHPHDAPVELLVYSRDQRWYFQAKPEKNGNQWSCEVTFGDETSPAGTEYTLVAMIIDVTKKPPLEQLPEGTVHTTKVVVRG